MRQGKYSRYVPSIFKEAEVDASFMERYLKIFEQIFSITGDESEIKNEKDQIDVIPDLFNPLRVKDDLLPFLAGCMGLILKEGWDNAAKREIIARIIPLYRKRGTRKGLEEYLKICTGYSVEVIEELRPLQVGITSHVGKDTILGGLPPFYFVVNVKIPASSLDFPAERFRIEELIDQEKPIHTGYSLNIIGDMK